jgi:uncharacterized protein (DUF1697 family)
MAELRRVFEDAGCADVQTYIQSGNVLFRKRASDRTRLSRRLERAVDDAFCHAFLARKPAPKDVRRLQGLEITPDEVKIVGSDVFVRYPRGVQGTRLSGAVLERELGIPGTNRNWRTVARLAELAKTD